MNSLKTTIHIHVVEAVIPFNPQNIPVPVMNIKNLSLTYVQFIVTTMTTHVRSTYIINMPHYINC